MNKKSIFVFSFVIVLYFSYFLSFGFENNKENFDQTTKQPYAYNYENVNNGMLKGGHDTITSEGILLKEKVHKQIDPDGGSLFIEEFSTKALNSFRSGAHDEDTNWLLNFWLKDPPIEPNEWGNFFHHFYNPSTNKGFKRYFKSSLERAKGYSDKIWQMVCGPKGNNLSDSEKRKVYYYFGRILHLLQDMAVPSHTKDDTHVFKKNFESYVNDHWREIVNADSFKERVTTQKYLEHNFGAFNAVHPHLLMARLANKAHTYPDEEELIDTFEDANGVSYSVLNEARLKKNVEDLIPEAIHYTGAYINSIYDLMRGLDGAGYDCSKPPLPRNPGGDHPDDRFDVSDEFYWEKEFKITQDHLIDLLLRTATKKGKIGVWYKKKLIEKFIEGKKLPVSASSEEKESAEAKFQKWSKKLDERVNEAESDLRGAPDVALFTNGFYDPSISLLLKISEPAAFLDLIFDPQIVKDHPVMLIPSGGFYGLEKSSLIKLLLSEYVKNGGTLIVFAQQHGYDWKLLPTPENPETGETKPVMGYGYREDQNCTFNSVYIDTYHPILSNFSTSTLNIGVDGYFTSYPENSTVLLRRTANGQPAMILYPYGQGYVIATTLYTDFALTHGQSNQAEINLIHNIISWAKKPVSLPEIKPGESLNLDLTLHNFTDQGAVAVKFTVLDVNRKVVEEKVSAISLPPGQSLSISFPYTSRPSSALGIYHVDYSLLDQKGEVIQPQAEIDSGRFAVSNPPPTGSPDKPFWFFITTSSQEVIFGGTLDYTFHIINNTDEARTLTIKNRFRHTHRERQWTVVADPQKETLISATDLFLDTWMFETMEAVLYDETGNIIGRSELSFRGLWPTVKSSLSVDKNLYRRNEKVNIQAQFHSNFPLAWEATIKTSIFNYFNQKVFEDNPQVIAFAPYEKKSHTIDFLNPVYLKPGSYLVRVEIWFADRLVSSAAANFELAESRINVTPILPSSLGGGTNNFSFFLENVGKIDVSSGSLEISLKDPNGQEVFSQVSPFDIKIGESKTINLPITLSNLQFGNYTLSFRQTDETKGVNILEGNTSIPNTIILTAGFDKTYYRVRETATLSARLENRGKFLWENAELNISIPEANFSTSTPVTLAAGDSRLIPIDFTLPPTLSPGFHYVNLSFNLPGGSSFTQKAQLAILPSSLEARYTGPEDLKAGDTINLTLENIGGVDAIAETQVTLSGNGEVIYRKNFSDLLRAGDSLNYSIPISSQATDGSYMLIVDYLNKSTQERKALWQSLNISGVKVDLSLRSDKDIYFRGELVKALCQINNKEYAIDQGVLNLKLVKDCSALPTSYYFYTLEGGSWIERGVLSFGNNFETKLIDLSNYLLSDVTGGYKLRIKHIGEGSAQIDHIALIADGVFYAPTAAIVIGEDSFDIRPEILSVDQWAADVSNYEIEIQWTGIPESSSKIIIMSAMEGQINWSCQQFIYWEKDIAIMQNANVIRNLSEETLSLYSPGNYLLKGVLISRTGQAIAESEYPFGVGYQGIGFRFSVVNPIIKLGDTIVIATEIINARSTDVTEISLRLTNIYGEVISERYFPNIPANSVVSFDLQLTDSTIGEKIFKINLYRGNIWLIGDRGKYEVVNPPISVTASAPRIAGRHPFPIEINMENTGKVPVSLQLSIQGGSLSDQKSISLLPKEKKQISYMQSIKADTNYYLNITGDLNQEINIPVIFGEKLAIAFSPENTYTEGKVALPVSLQNIGQVAEEVKVAFRLKQGEVIIQEKNKDYFLPKGTSQNDILYFDLKEGDYQILAQSILPQASTQAIFSVKKENKLDMAILAGAQTGGVFPVKAEISNQGYKSISGLLRISLQDRQNSLWKCEEIISSIPAGSSLSISLHLDPAGIVPGNYNLKAEFLNPEGRLLVEKIIPLSIQGPSFQLIQIPPFQTFSPGQEASFTFRIKNAGSQGGSFNFHFKSYDLIDLKRTEWLKPGEEKNLEFSFLLPRDFEEKDYEATYELVSSGNAPIQGQVKYHLAGIKIDVQAALDKAAYREGEIAHLTLTISGDQNQSLFARVNYPGFEAKEAFTLQGTKVLSFDIPLPKITGDKLFYAIYQESGRSLYLNSLYIYKLGEKINLVTDKQVYKPGEPVAVTISSGQAGIQGPLTLSAPNYEETFIFSENITKTFTLPSSMTAGTYYVSYNLLSADGEIISGTHPFDVDGLKVKVKEASLEKASYAPGEIINLSLNVESSHDLEAILKTWIVDPEKNHSPPQIREIHLQKNELSLFTKSLILATQKQGLHQLIYGIYSKEGFLLCAGLEGFEVGSGTILSLSTDKVDYPSENEPVLVKVNLFTSSPATLNLILNGELKGSYPIPTINFSNFQIQINVEKPGLNTLQAVLTSEGLSSIKETSFTYGSGLPDLAVWINGAKVENGLIKLSITVINRGKSASLPTLLKLYDGQVEEGNLLAIFEVKSLFPKESQTFTYQMPISGRVGVNEFIALVGQKQHIIDFNKNNNESRISLQVKADETEKGFILSANETSKKIELGEEVEFNLTLTPLNGLTGDVHLTIKDCPSGFSASFAPNPVSLGESILTTLKLIPSGQVQSGHYNFSISASINGQIQELALELKVTDFEIRITPQVQTVKQLAEAIYSINIKPLHGFDNPVSLELFELPKGIRANLSANEITSSSGATLTIITSKWLKPGVYNFSIIAKGKKLVHEEMATLIIEANPLLKLGIITAPIKDKNPIIRTFLADGTMIDHFELSLDKAEIFLAAGDGDGDGVDEIIIGADKKGKGPYPLVKVFRRDGTSMATLESEGWYKLGATVAAGDIDGDWIEEIVVGYYTMAPKEMVIYDDLEIEEIYSLCHGKKKGRGLIKVYKLIDEEFIDTGLALEPYKEEDFWGTPRVALGDIDGDGQLELITAPGPDPKAPARIKVFKIDTSKGLGNWRIKEKILDLTVSFEEEKGKKKIKIEDGYGANVAAGDIDGDGKAEIIVGAGPDPKKDGQIIIIYPTEKKKESFQAYPENRWGVNVASGDLNNDGKAEIIIGPGLNPKRTSTVKIFKRDGTLIKEFQPYPGDAKFGISVTSGQVGR